MVFVYEAYSHSFFMSPTVFPVKKPPAFQMLSSAERQNVSRLQEKSFCVQLTYYFCLSIWKSASVVRLES